MNVVGDLESNEVDSANLDVNYQELNLLGFFLVLFCF